MSNYGPVERLSESVGYFLYPVTGAEDALDARAASTFPDKTMEAATSVATF